MFTEGLSRARPGSKHAIHHVIRFLQEPLPRSRNLGTEMSQDMNQDKVIHRTIKLKIKYIIK